VFGLEYVISKKLLINDFPTATKKDRVDIGYGKQDIKEGLNTSVT
jgi:hypothetical protein